MKKFARPFGAFLFALFVSALFLGNLAPLVEAAPPIPPEVKDFTLRFMKDFGNASLSLAERLESTENPEEMARALTAYADAVEPLAQGMVALQKKYPDFFADLDDDDEMTDPDILKAEDAFDKTQERMEPAMIKVFHNIEHPSIMTALERLEEVMAIMDGGELD